MHRAAVIKEPKAGPAGGGGGGRRDFGLSVFGENSCLIIIMTRIGPFCEESRPKFYDIAVKNHY